MATNYIVWSKAGLKKYMDTGGARTWLNGGTLYLRLFTNTFSLTYASVLGDFTQATFGGYAAQALGAFAAPADNGSGVNQDCLGTLQTFTYASGVISETIRGYYVTDVTPTDWYFAQFTNISPAAIMDAVGKFYQIQPRITGAPLLAYP